MALTTDACARETRAFCAREADLLALVQSTAAASDDRVRVRRQRVRDCLVDHADELSPECVARLVGDVATQQHSALPTANSETDSVATKQDEQQQQQEESSPEAAEAVAETPPTKDDTDNEVDATPTAAETKVPPQPKERDAEPTKPVILKLPPQQYSAAPLSVTQPQPAAQPSAEPVPQPMQGPPQPHYAQTSGDMETGIEVRIFLVNHQGPSIAAAPAAAPSYIRIGGDANADGNNGNAAVGSAMTGAVAAATGVGMSPWAWVMILPFMCIGMYVSAVQTIAFVRRRRDVVYRVGASQYMPIPTSLNPSKH